MTLRFRNLDISPDQAVSEWPGEAVLTALERGSLRDWRRLARAVEEDPWGRTARQIEQALRVSRPYGIAPAMERAIENARRRKCERERREVAGRVQELVVASGLERKEFAERVGTSTSRLSTYATGRVVPSASMLLRMEELAERCRQPR